MILSALLWAISFLTGGQPPDDGPMVAPQHTVHAHAQRQIPPRGRGRE